MFKIRTISLILILFIIGSCPSFVFKCLGANSDYKKGNLTNGLTFYIHENPENTGKVSFYLVVKAGSLHEEDSHSGLAHLMEHMAFKGTKQFPGRTIIEYLQNKNVKFGTDLNAVTSFDKTLFKIENVSNDDPLIDTCLLILRDWSKDILLLPEDIDAERRVINQEWLTTSSSQKRVRKQFSEQLLPEDNPYRNKTPIGDLEYINSFPYNDLNDFYTKWYRPDFQAIIVEGDIDAEEIENKIKILWKDVERPESPITFSMPSFPEFENPLVAIACDSGIRNNSIDIQLLQPLDSIPQDQEDFYNKLLTEEIIASIFSYRLRERGWRNDSIVKGGAAYIGSFMVADNISAFTIGASYKGNQWDKALDTLVYEAKRIIIEGITEDELRREIGELERKLNYLNNNKSEYLSNKFIDNFTLRKPIINRNSEIEFLNEFIDTISKEYLNSVARKIIHPDGKNTVLLLREKENETHSKKGIEDTFFKGWEQNILPYTPYNFIVNDKKEIEITIPEKGNVDNIEWLPELNADRLTLSNGARIYLPVSETENGFVQILAISKGGISFSENKIPDYSIINNIIKLNRLGKNSGEVIREISEEKQINWNVIIDNVSKRFTGKAPIENVESLLQIMYLVFTSSQADSVEYNSWKNNYKKYIENRNHNPYSLVTDSVSKLIYGNDIINNNSHSEFIDRINYGRIIELIKGSFSNVSDFDFIITGLSKEKEWEDLIKKYIASIPKETNTWEIPTIIPLPYPVPVKQTITFDSGISNQGSTISKTIMGKVPNTLQNRLTLNIITELLKDNYLKNIRDKAGGAYNIHVVGEITRNPENLLSLNINFITGSEDYHELISMLDEGIIILESGDFDLSLLTGIKKGLLNDFENYKKTGEYKLYLLQDYILYNTLETKDYTETLNSIGIREIQELSKQIRNAPTNLTFIIY